MEVVYWCSRAVGHTTGYRSGGYEEDVQRVRTQDIARCRLGRC